MDLLTVRRLFEPYVRSRLDWGRLAESSESASLEVLETEEQVGRIYTTWYVDKRRNQEVSFDSTNSKPLMVLEVQSVLPALNDSRRRNLESFVGPSESSNPFMVLIYQTPSADRILLDGNHRLVRKYLQRQETPALGLSL